MRITIRGFLDIALVTANCKSGFCVEIIIEKFKVTT